MKWLKALAAYFDTPKKSEENEGRATGHPRDPVIAEWWIGNSMSESGAYVTPDTAMRVSAVYACVRILAESIASLPCILYRLLPNEGKERDRAHPLYGLIHDQPNAWQTSFEFWEMLTGHLALRGDAYAEIIGAGGSAVTSLIPLHPDRVRPVLVERDGSYAKELTATANLAYLYTPLSGKDRIILQDEMLHLRGLSSNGIQGLSPITLQRETIGRAIAIRDYGSRFYRNSAQPGGVLQVPVRFKDDDEREKFRASWIKAHAGGNAHRVAVLEAGIEWKQVGMSNEDAQYIETEKLSGTDIARIFRIPPHMIGDLERSTNNNIEHQAIEFVTHTLRPWLVRIEKAIRRDLFIAPWRRTHTVEFLIDGLLRGDLKSRYEAYGKAVGGPFLVANEVRAKENLNPMEEFSKPLRPLNMSGSVEDDKSKEAA